VPFSPKSIYYTFSELQTVMFEVANLLNERPIGTKETDHNEGSYLCPNDLIAIIFPEHFYCIPVPTLSHRVKFLTCCHKL
jgi:hypothetical protein